MSVLGRGTIAPGRYDNSSSIGGDMSSTAAPDSLASLSANWIRVVERPLEEPATNQAPIERDEPR